MKVTKLLKKLDSSIDKLYDALYAVRDSFDEVEDEEIDYMINGFVEQIEQSIVDGDFNVGELQSQIRELPE
jgi:hypothetical protein